MLNGEPYHVVLVPSAPVPVGGALVYVPVKWVKPADIGIEGLMSIYVAMGVTSRQPGMSPDPIKPPLVAPAPTAPRLGAGPRQAAIGRTSHRWREASREEIIALTSGREAACRRGNE